MTDPPADVFLLPGPVKMDPRVLQAMTRPAMNHRGPEFKEILADVRTLTQYLFGTKGEVAVLSGSGTAGLEAAVTGLVRKEDRVLNLVNGKFSQRFHELCGVFAHASALSFEWGTAVGPKKGGGALVGGGFRGATGGGKRRRRASRIPWAGLRKVVNPRISRGSSDAQGRRYREPNRANDPARGRCEGDRRRPRPPTVPGSEFRVEHRHGNQVSRRSRRLHVPEDTPREASDDRGGRPRSSERSNLPNRTHGHLFARRPRGRIPGYRGHAPRDGPSDRPRRCRSEGGEGVVRPRPREFRIVGEVNAKSRRPRPFGIAD